MRNSPRCQVSLSHSSPEQRFPAMLWLFLLLGLCLTFINVLIIVSQVDTQSQQFIINDNAADSVVISPEYAARRIASSSKQKVDKVPPPIIHGVEMPLNITASPKQDDAVQDDAVQDDVDEGYDSEEEESEEEEGEEEDEESEDEEASESGDDDWYLGDDEENATRDTSLDEPEDKKPLLRILKEAGFDKIDNVTLATLPTWKEVTRLYGSSPKIYGLEQSCSAFRNHSDLAEHFIGTAGNFNTGTNFLSELLIHNCFMTDRMAKYGAVNKGVRWQVPWGKHSPPLNDEFRRTHKTKPGDENIEAHNVMPIVTIRDPYVWMQSMCRHNYGAYWPSDTGHCPNLIPDERDIKPEPWLKYKKSVPIDVQYSADAGNRQHDSLVHFWNEWYGDYLKATFPRIMVRFEDLIFHAKEVITQVCECAGGTMQPKFTYITNSAKKGSPGAHGSKHDRTSFIDALVRYGKDTDRLNGFTKDDIEFARSNLNLELMNLFSYQFDEPPRSIQ